MSRSFWQTWCSLFTAATLAAYAEPEASLVAAWEKMPAHPRLLANAARFAQLKTQTDPVSTHFMELLRGKAAHALAAAPLIFPETGLLLWQMREMQDRILTLAMMYRLAGEERYLEGAQKNLRQLAGLPEWGTGHFLDVGEACLAAGLGLDWLYDSLAPADRDLIANAIVERGLRPSLAVKDEPGSWVTGDFNWNQVCHAGLSVGALAVAEREPALARRIVERAIRYVPNAGAAYAPDGSYPEGPSYWSYGTVFHIILIEALRSTLGTARGLESLPGFLKTPEFKLQMVAPSGEDYNFSDYHTEHQNQPTMLWFARELDRCDFAKAETDQLAERAKASQVNPAPNPQLQTSRHLACEFLWWNPHLSATKQELPLHWTASGMLPVAVLRSAWDDPRATYLAIKGGTPNHSHAHMDVGSFILEANGVRWARDLGTENYGRMRAAKLDLWNYAQDSSRWTAFRVGPAGHNILRFDEALQDVTGTAEIQALPDEGGVVGDLVELTTLYKDLVEKVVRRVHLYPDRSVSIEDAWTTGARPAAYAFQWLTQAKVVSSAEGLELTEAGESLALRIESSGKWEIEIEDVAKPRQTTDSTNPGLTRITVRLPSVPQSTNYLTIKAIPGS